MAELHLTVDGDDIDAGSLYDWLRSEPDLRGRLKKISPSGPDGQNP